MDPTSFAVGVISLAGLVSTCIEAFQILRSINAFNRDAEILFVKLDIEKELFLSWAREVGLLKRGFLGQGGSREEGRRGKRGDGDRERSLFDKRTDLLIYRVLKEIRTLLCEAAGMEGRYAQNSPSSETNARRRVGYHYDDSNSHSHSHSKRSRSIDRGQEQEQEQGKKVSFGRKFIWTVHGRDELKSLIDELGYFIGKLYQMIPSVEQRKASLKELKEAGADVGTLSMLMLAEGRSGSSYAGSDGGGDGEWSDLASEVASKAEERVGLYEHGGRRRGKKDGEVGCERRRSRKEAEEEVERRRERNGSHVSGHSHHSSKSNNSSSGSYGSPSGSYRSSRSTLVEMFGDMVGSGGRPSSTFR